MALPWRKKRTDSGPDNPERATAPCLLATTDEGDEHLDPSEDVLFRLLEDVGKREEGHVIVGRLPRTDDQTYVQTLRQGDGTWLVEHRDGSPERHYSATTSDMRTVHLVLTHWAFDRDGWREALDWTPVVL